MRTLARSRGYGGQPPTSELMPERTLPFFVATPRAQVAPSTPVRHELSGIGTEAWATSSCTPVY